MITDVIRVRKISSWNFEIEKEKLNVGLKLLGVQQNSKAYRAYYDVIKQDAHYTYIHNYSHSVVPGGLEVRSYKTLSIP